MYELRAGTRSYAAGISSNRELVRHGEQSFLRCTNCSSQAKRESARKWCELC